MKIIADENIPFVKQAFSHLGEVTTLPGRQMTAQSVRDAEILLVRSVTKVDQELLEGSSVRFVATATIGTDHIDLAYLQKKGIGFSDAAGSNANSVAEYVMAAILCLAHRKNWELEKMTLGVVGVGNIGSKVVRMAQGLGMQVLQNDPPLARKTGESRFLPLDALMAADIITIHVPLTYEGEDATHYLFDTERISKMKDRSTLFNTSRGGVVSEDALKRAILLAKLEGLVLDVWENEPQIDTQLLRAIDLGTPHIAGYSFDGKVNGTNMIYRAVCHFLGVEPRWHLEEIMPPPMIPHLMVKVTGETDEQALHSVIKQIYDIQRDDAALRQVLQLKPNERAGYFDQLRKNYPVRREFFNTELTLVNASERLRRKFAALGFRVAQRLSENFGSVNGEQRSF
ncbi:MAG: 4-phosphoerythronate dehydrogenase PdxB [candidate division KSB1 bacterium]|nr:4-phosphoerythronate dehydrogenase PdxB [candidate division KSB1 bacterium]